MDIGLIEASLALTPVVVGGVAATAHGSTYVTNDLEICYETTPGKIERLAALLARWNAYPRGIERGPPFFGEYPMPAYQPAACR